MADIEVRDIGKDNPFSMKDGIIFKTRAHLFLFDTFTFITAWQYHFKITPRKYKIHRSAHPYVFFAISVYLPWRYEAKINTLVAVMSGSKNSWVNFALRIPTKVLAYGGSILVG